MSKLKIKLGIAVLTIFLIGNIFIISKDSPKLSTSTQPTATTTPTTSKQYTLAEVSKHNSAQSCWGAVNGKVYDLTAWISKHPGGSPAILSLCGKDGSFFFNKQHSGQSNPAKALANFIIGDLIQ